MKSKLLWMIAAATLILGILLYHYRSGSDLNVTPEAEREIEKAKRR